MQAGTIALILNISFVVILILGFLIGMWRGAKKSIANLIFSLAGVVVAFFCCGIVTNAILGVKIEGQTFNQLIIDWINGAIGDNSFPMTVNMQAFIAKLPYAIMNVVVFLLMAIAVSFVTYLIYRIIASIFLKNKDKEGNVKKKYRITGGVINAVKTFVLMMFVIMPFVSLIDLASDLTNSSSVSYVDAAVSTEDSGKGLLGQRIPDAAVNAINGIDSSAFGVIGNMFGLDNLMFDYLSEFELEGEKVHFREDITNINNVYSAYLQISNLATGKTYSNINFQKLNNSIDSIFDSGLFKVVLDEMATELIVNYQDYTLINIENFGEFKDVFLNVRDYMETNKVTFGGYLSNDIKLVLDGASGLAKSGALDEITNLSDINEILFKLTNTEEKKTELNAALNKVLSTNVVKDSLNTVLELVAKQIVENPELVANGRDPEYNSEALATSLTNVISYYAGVANEVDITKLLKDPMILIEKPAAAQPSEQTQEPKLINITTVLSNLGKLIDEMLSIDEFVGSDGNNILKPLLDDSGFVIPAESEVIYAADGSSVTIKSYSALCDFIAPSLTALRDADVYEDISANNMTQALEKLANAEKAEEGAVAKILLPLVQVEPTKSAITTKLADNDLIKFSTLTTNEDWKNDLTNVATLLTALNKGEIGTEKQTYLEIVLGGGNFDTVLDNLASGEISQILKPMLYAKSTTTLRDSLFTKFVENVNKLVTNKIAPITLADSQFAGEKDQADSVCAVFEAFMAFYKDDITDIKDMDATKLGNFLNALKGNAKFDNAVFGDAFNSIANEVNTKLALGLAENQFATTDWVEVITEKKAEIGA